MRKSLIILLSLTACGTSVQSTAETRARIQTAPSWYLQRPQSNDYIYGVATAQSEDMDLAVEMAHSFARADIGRQMEVQLGTLQKRFQEQTRVSEGSELLQQFSSAYRQVVSQTLAGVRVKEQTIVPGRNIYIVYAIMEMPIGDSNRQFVENLRRSESLYTRMRSTQLYQELDASVRALDSTRAPR